MKVAFPIHFIFILFLVENLCLSTFVRGSSIHGGTFLALAGKNATVLASDSRFSSYITGSLALGNFHRKIFQVGSKVVVGCFGLDSDAFELVHALREKFVDHTEEDLSSTMISRVISDLLYDQRWMLSPIITGLDESNQPFICTMDGLGAQTHSRNFAVLGTASSGLFGICESFDLSQCSAEELVAIAEHCFKMAVQRDVLSGGNIRIITVTQETIYAKDIQFDDV